MTPDDPNEAKARHLRIEDREMRGEWYDRETQSWRDREGKRVD
jgi:hypothetical protein